MSLLNQGPVFTFDSLFAPFAGNPRRNWHRLPSREGATLAVLERRACYGGRKGNSARRRLGFRPSTSAEAYRAWRVVRALRGGGQPLPPSDVVGSADIRRLAMPILLPPHQMLSLRSDPQFCSAAGGKR